MAKKITLKNKNGDVLCPHTAIEQVQGLKDALDGKLGKTEKVSSATEADSAHKLDVMSVRPTSANVSTADGGLYQFKTYTNMTEGYPGKDGHIIHSSWDTSGWSSQLFLGTGYNTSVNDRMKFRWQVNGVWQDWKTVAFTDSNVASATKATQDGDGNIITGSYAKRNVYSLGYSKIAKIDFYGQLYNTIIFLRGTNSNRTNALWVSGYGDGTNLRTNLRFLYRQDNYQVYCNGSSESATIYIKSNFTEGEDELCIISANRCRPTVTIIDTLPQDAQLMSIDSNTLATEDKIEFINLLPNSKEITIDATATASGGTKYASKKLPIPVKVGDVLTFNCEDMIINAGTDQTHALLLYEPNVGALATAKYVSPSSKTAKIVVEKASSNAYLYLYADISNNSAGKSITYKGATLVKGDKPMQYWRRSLEDSITNSTYASSLRDPSHYTQSTRRKTANVNFGADGGLHYFLATGSITDNSAPEGHIIHCDWDNGPNSWLAQLLIKHGPNNGLLRRYKQYSTDSWSNWITMLDDKNFANYALAKTGGTLTGDLTAPTYKGATDKSGVYSEAIMSYTSAFANNDLNSERFLKAGMYRLDGVNDTINQPGGRGYGHLMTIRGGNSDNAAQMFFDYFDNGNTYIRTGSTNPNAGDFYILNRAWKQLLEDQVTTSHIAEKSINGSKIVSNVDLTGTPMMGVEPTLSSPDKTIASVGLVKEAVDGIEIGGVNLILNSDFSQGTEYWSIWKHGVGSFTVEDKIATFFFGATSGQGLLQTSLIYIESGQQYTMSFNVRSDNVTSIDSCYLMSMEGVSNIRLTNINGINSSWQRIEYHFTASQTGNYYFGLGLSNSPGGSFQIKRVKIEKGNKATDWSPAPEDVEAKIESVKPTIFLQTLQPSATEVKEGDIWIIQ